jgi:hypothetical protein
VSPNEWRSTLARLLAASKLVSDEQTKGTGRTVLPRIIARHGAIERLLEQEQHELAGLIGDAVALLRNGPSEAGRTALFKRAETLSSSALLTAKALIKAHLDSKRGNSA